MLLQSVLEYVLDVYDLEIRLHAKYIKLLTNSYIFVLVGRI